MQGTCCCSRERERERELFQIPPTDETTGDAHNITLGARRVVGLLAELLCPRSYV